MEIVRLILLCGHLIGLSLVVGGFLIQLMGRNRTVIPAMMRGAELQIVTGILLVGAREIEDLPVNNAKIAVKFVVGVAVVACAAIGRRRRSEPLFYATGGLALLNVVIAVFWT